jgi:hypothetical protein
MGKYRFAQSEDLVQWTSLVVAKIATYPNLAQEFYVHHCGHAYLTVRILQKQLLHNKVLYFDFDAGDWSLYSKY